MNNFELPEEQHKKRIEEILKTVPQEYRNWLEEKLKYSNEKTLRKRLKELLDNFADILDNSIPDKDSFINKVVEWRNSLTHPERKTKEESKKGEELYNLSQKLKQLLEICLLKELGFSSDNIKNSISRNIRYY
jgi:RecG-like helicase